MDNMKRSNAERQRDYRNARRNESVAPETESVTVNTVTAPVSVTPTVTPIEWQDVDHSIFEGYGRGVPVNGYVLVTRRSPSHKGSDLVGELSGVVKVGTWRSRLLDTCKHGFSGWACKPCMA